MKKVLAFDYGASSGRAILFTYDNGRVDSTEIHRFENVPITKGDTLYWDFDRLTDALFTGIKKGVEAGGFDSIGIDTWGVDFGLLDAAGRLLDTPVHYRDKRTDDMPPAVFGLVDKRRIYDRTGIQTMNFNTIFQLFYLKTHEPELYGAAEAFLFMPDLFAYLLTGAKYAERTIASTSQLLNVRTKEWDAELIDALGLKASLFPPLLDSGARYGTVSKAIQDKTGCPPVPVVAVCCHDTASAVFSVPAKHKNPLFLSSGTWSLLGVELDEPVLSDGSFAADCTNETGYGKSTRYLKNIMGMWIINECRREWKKTAPISFDEIVGQAKASKGGFYIDVNDELFAKPGDMPQKIQAYCHARGAAVPKTCGDIARCVYDSLVVKYGEVIKTVSALTNKRFDTLYIVGGGCKNEYLSGLIAKALRIRVSAGPVEATAIGNAFVQLITLGCIDSWEQARALIAESFDVKEFI
ncbi:MAG: rhamnulokinase [Clostridiales bacterium]|jgi:sugar (pentulose or hexulose) kinase|nr:rhamnulokinase [Clostridiales bacterium]